MKKIRKPKIPRGEDPQVTIKNQERLISFLVDRCQQWQKRIDSLHNMDQSIQKSHELEREIFNRTARELNDKTNAYTRMLGWQDCAREMLELRADTMAASLP